MDFSVYSETTRVVCQAAAGDFTPSTGAQAAPVLLPLLAALEGPRAVIMKTPGRGRERTKPEYAAACRQSVAVLAALQESHPSASLGFYLSFFANEAYVYGSDKDPALLAVAVQHGPASRRGAGWRQRCRALAAQGRSSEAAEARRHAIELFEQALKEEPGDLEARMKLAKTRFENGEDAEAIKTCLSALDYIHQECPPAINLVGIVSELRNTISLGLARSVDQDFQARFERDMRSIRWLWRIGEIPKLGPCYKRGPFWEHRLPKPDSRGLLSRLLRHQEGDALPQIRQAIERLQALGGDASDLEQAQSLIKQAHESFLPVLLGDDLVKWRKPCGPSEIAHVVSEALLALPLWTRRPGSPASVLLASYALHMVRALERVESPGFLIATLCDALVRASLGDDLALLADILYALADCACSVMMHDLIAEPGFAVSSPDGHGAGDWYGAALTCCAVGKALDEFGNSPKRFEAETSPILVKMAHELETQLAQQSMDEREASACRLREIVREALNPMRECLASFVEPVAGRLKGRLGRALALVHAELARDTMQAWMRQQEQKTWMEPTVSPEAVREAERAGLAAAADRASASAKLNDLALFIESLARIGGALRGTMVEAARECLSAGWELARSAVQAPANPLLLLHAIESLLDLSRSLDDRMATAGLVSLACPLLDQCASHLSNIESRSRLINHGGVFVRAGVRAKAHLVGEGESYLGGVTERYRSLLLRSLMATSEGEDAEGYQEDEPGQASLFSRWGDLFMPDAASVDIEVAADLRATMDELDMALQVTRNRMWSRRPSTPVPEPAIPLAPGLLREFVTPHPAAEARGARPFPQAAVLSVYPFPDGVLVSGENAHSQKASRFAPWTPAQGIEILRTLNAFLKSRADADCFTKMNKVAGPSLIPPVLMVAEELGCSPGNDTLLALVGHEWASRLPLHVLSPSGEGGDELDEGFPTSVLPCASAIPLLLERRRKSCESSQQGAAKTVLAGHLLGQPDSVVREYLEETQRVLGHPCEIIAGAGVRPETILALPGPVAELFLLAHGKHFPNHPFLSLLALNRRRPLTVHDLVMAPRRDIDMVAICACMSALTSCNPADEFLGLGHAFLSFGARSVIGALWSIPWHASLDLYYLFHGFRSQGMDKVRALRAARRQLRWAKGFDRRASGPDAHWAGYVTPSKGHYRNHSESAGPVLLGDPY